MVRGIPSQSVKAASAAYVDFSSPSNPRQPFHLRAFRFSSSVLMTKPRLRSYPLRAGVRHKMPNHSLWRFLMTPARSLACSMHSCLRSSCCRAGGLLVMYQTVSTRVHPSFLAPLSSCGDDVEVTYLCTILPTFSSDAWKRAYTL